MAQLRQMFEELKTKIAQEAPPPRKKKSRACRCVGGGSHCQGT